MKDYIYIPHSREAAERNLQRALAKGLAEISKIDFLKAYCSVAYLYPGFHPDDWEDWEGPAEIKPLLCEAWRRASEEELTDNELYPYQAVKAAIVRARQGGGTASGTVGTRIFYRRERR
jgi:hypothetical protein